jgi:acetyl-CoA C-acetyltransferase
MEKDKDRLPVIAGAGEITDKPSDPFQAMEPAALMAEALLRAGRDASAHLLASVDSLDVINEISWPYLDPCAEVAARAKLSPRRAVYGPVGGQTPVSAIHDAALRIARGESKAAAICGAEAEHAVRQAAKAGVTLPWSGKDEDHVPVRASTFQQPAARALGAVTPAHVYPFYENAFQKAQGQTPDQGQDESAAVWAGYSAVAARRPAAWLTRPYTAREIRAVSPQNRLIAWPYPKLMTANPAVNQGAAIILTSAGHAKRAGIPPERLIHILGGAAAEEPQDYLARHGYEAVPAMQAVLTMMRCYLPPGQDRFDHYELYSCFPCIPKMARRLLGLGLGTPLTVTGGLTFFGAPLNNYMSHAAVAMVEQLRANPGQTGLLYGQGGYATKHHALALSSGEAPRSPLAASYHVQPEAGAFPQPIQRFIAAFEGSARLETFTVLFGRDGEPQHGIAIARSDPDTRLIARIPACDTEAIAKLLSPEANPIGAAGRATMGSDGTLQWRFV